MNRTPDVELVLRDYFADDGLTAPDYVLDVVAERIGRQPRRGTWRLPWRLNSMNRTTSYAVTLAAVVVVAVVGYNLLPGVSGPGAPSAAPTPTPTPPSPTFGSGLLPEGKLVAGHYTMPPHPDFPNVTLAADIPAGWVGFPEVPALVSPTKPGADGVLIGFMKADGLFSDPCHWDIDGTGADNQPGDVVVGVSVDELVNALRANASYTSSTASPVTVGGFEGAEIELTLPGDDVLQTCDSSASDPASPKYRVFGNGFWAQGPNNHWRLFILDVDQDRVIVMLNFFAEIPQADLVAARAIVDSLVITP